MGFAHIVVKKAFFFSPRKIYLFISNENDQTKRKPLEAKETKQQSAARIPHTRQSAGKTVHPTEKNTHTANDPENKTRKVHSSQQMGR